MSSDSAMPPLGISPKETKAYIAYIHTVCCVQSLSCVRLFVTPLTVIRQAPLSMEFSRQDSRAGCHALLQGIFLTQELNPVLPHHRQILYHLSYQGSPYSHYDSAIPHLGISPKERKAYAHKSACTRIFIMAPNWKQFTCPSVEDGHANCNIDT